MLGTPRALGASFAVVMIAVAAQACTIASPVYVQPVEQNSTKKKDADAKTTSDDAPASGATCGTDDFVKPDLATLTACGGGKGHCFDKTKTPMGDKLSPCPGSSTDVCVPDNILEAGGGKIASCTSIIGPGACATIDLIPEMKERGGSALQQDVCDAGQVCAPCVDPTNGNAKTGLCEAIGVHENACSGGSDSEAKTVPSTPCCKSASSGKDLGMCIAESGVPEAQRESTTQDTCAAGNKCVPAAMATGKPVMCNSLFGTAVCVGACFNDMLALGGIIFGSEGCDPEEICVPCGVMPGDVQVPGCTQSQ